LAMLRQTSCIGCEAIGRSLKTSKTSSKTSNIASNVSSNKKFKHYVTLCVYNEISFLRSTSPAPMGLFTCDSEAAPHKFVSTESCVYFFGPAPHL
jgi:hypothetical protein